MSLRENNHRQVRVYFIGLLRYVGTKIVNKSTNHWQRKTNILTQSILKQVFAHQSSTIRCGYRGRTGLRPIMFLRYPTVYSIKLHVAPKLKSSQIKSTVIISILLTKYQYIKWHRIFHFWSRFFSFVYRCQYILLPDLTVYMNNTAALL